MELIKAYFPELTAHQEKTLNEFIKIFSDWNDKINLISRKDLINIEERHILHSLGIAKFVKFKPGTIVADAGTGGGFPGIPLAILFPEVEFRPIDSINKKINVVKDIAEKLNLNNIIPICSRIENVNKKFDFIVSRAVTDFPSFVKLIKGKINYNSFNDIENGIIYLKGGDLKSELRGFKTAKVINLSDYFEESFFETKKIIYFSDCK